MARRRGNKIDPSVIVAGFLILAIAGVVNALGANGTVALLIVLVGGIVLFKFVKHQRRLDYLRTKYGDEDIVERIMRRRFWQGQTAEQLRDSVGSPVQIDNKIMATRKREIWKYRQTGRNRYALRITLDDDVVIGWDQKN
jgi:hypothetical protein